jgi:hypothetical protein
MDFFAQNLLAKGRDSALFLDYSSLRNDTLSKIRAQEDGANQVFAICKQNWKSQGMIYLFHCLDPKESLEEFCELFYEVVWHHFGQSKLDPVARCVDTLFLYFFYEIQPGNKHPVCLNDLILEAYSAHLSQDLQATKDILKLMMHKNAFSLSYLSGLKTRIVSNKGIVLKLISIDKNSEGLIKDCGNLLRNQQFALEIKKSQTAYFQAKNTFLKSYVENDSNEPIDYDEDTKQFGLKLEKDLNKVTEFSLTIPNVPLFKK